MISERQKYLHNALAYRNTYFWRNHAQSEIDYIEEYNGALHTYEIKWGNKPIKPPKSFMEAYPGSSFKVVNRDTFFDFLLAKDDLGEI